MKGPQVDQIVYEFMFPKPKSTDPQNFQGLLQRQLVPEVRLETQAFYGHLASQEAKYPGLDYSYRPHRIRLSRYQWHRRLFRAFDSLGLTKSEIAGLTKWEGTRWAKERFEKEQGIVIRDTTADDIEDWLEPEWRTPAVPQPQRAQVEEMEDLQEPRQDGDNEMDETADDSDAELHSVGADLNQRLRAAVASREAGNVTAILDEEWEQWLKDAVESGGAHLLSSDLGLTSDDLLPSLRQNTEDSARLLNAARLGQWQQIPGVLESITRQNREASRREGQQSAGPPTFLNPAPSSDGSRWAPRARLDTTTASSDGHNRRSYERTQFMSFHRRESLPPLSTSSGLGVNGIRPTGQGSNA